MKPGIFLGISGRESRPGCIGLLPSAGAWGLTLRFNGTTTGVRTLNPRANSVFDRSQVAQYDLRLFDSPSQVTMLRIGIGGTDGWCIK